MYIVAGIVLKVCHLVTAARQVGMGLNLEEDFFSVWCI